MLRRWREPTGLIQGAVVRALPEELRPRSPGTYSNWETGNRGEKPSPEQVSALDAVFDAGGALAGVWSAVRTPGALEPDRDWWMNFQGESRPCWAWVRTSSSMPVTGAADAGPFRVTFEVPPGEGLFLQAFAFASNPAVHVHLDGPGWVDFGYGFIPESLGVPIQDAADFAVVGPRGVSDSALAVVGPRVLKPKFETSDEGWFDRFKRVAGQRVEVARRAVTQTVKSALSGLTDLTEVPPLGEGQVERWRGEAYRRLREARGLTQKEAAQAATELGGAAVGPYDVGRLEKDVPTRVQQMVERLDMVYGADGRSCLATVFSTETAGDHLVEFPEFWIGPIWVEFRRVQQPQPTQATSTAPAKLEWRPWKKPLRLSNDVVVTCRRATKDADDLGVSVPNGWRMSAGVGVHPAAVDVNEGWGFVNTDAAKAALDHYYLLVMQALGRGGKT